MGDTSTETDLEGPYHGWHPIPSPQYPEAVDHEASGPRSNGPDAMDPEAMDSEAMDPEAMEPEATGKDRPSNSPATSPATSPKQQTQATGPKQQARQPAQAAGPSNRHSNGSFACTSIIHGLLLTMLFIPPLTVSKAPAAGPFHQCCARLNHQCLQELIRTTTRSQ